MTLGVAPAQPEIKTGDTADLYAALRIDEQPVGPDQISQVNFIVQKPDGTQQTLLGVPQDDGRGFVRWTDTAQAGNYLVQAQFTLVSGEIRSVMTSFAVMNPFGDDATVTLITGSAITFPGPTTIPVESTAAFPSSGSIIVAGITGPFNYTSTSPTSFEGVAGGGAGTVQPGTAITLTNTPSSTDLITGAVWVRIEDCFDSTEGGPWLREKTLANFDENKIAQFIPEAMLDINLQMPPTQFTVEMLTNWQQTPGDNPNMPIVVKATLVLVERHLMRSYVEQFTPQGGQVVWSDRTRYSQMWKAIYDVDYADYIQAVRLWKRTTLNLGHSAISIFNKSGRMWPYSNERARGAYRGFF